MSKDACVMSCTQYLTNPGDDMKIEANTGQDLNFGPLRFEKCSLYKPPECCSLAFGI